MQPATLPGAAAPCHGQWRAELSLAFARRRGASRLVQCRHEGPLYLQRPFYPEGPDCAHAYLLHPPGGIVSGDVLAVDVSVGEAAAALVTTPGAARVYRARETLSLQGQSTRLCVAAAGSLEWFPLETIVYDGADVRLDTRVELAPGAVFTGWEICCLGLPASGAPFRRGRLRQRYRVRRDGRTAFVDGLHLDARSAVRLAGRAGLAGQPVSGFFLAGPLPETCAELLPALREAGVPPGSAESRRSRPENASRQEGRDACGITQLGDFLVGRYLGASAERARALFARWWALLRPLLQGREACAPRIWLT